MTAAATIAEFGVSLLATLLGLPQTAKDIAVSAATLAATFATMRQKTPSYDDHVHAALTALQQAHFPENDLAIAKAWLHSRPAITLSPTKLAQHGGNLPAYLMTLLDDTNLPKDGATRTILHLCLTSAFAAIRTDATFHAPFAQEMLTQIRATVVMVDHKQDLALAGIAELRAMMIAQAQRDQPQLYAQHTEMLIALARNYATGPVTDFESAYKNLENALRVYDDMRRENALPRNAANHLDAVLARVQALVESASLDAASAELEAADTEARARMAARQKKIAQEMDAQAEDTSGRIRLLDRKVSIATLQNAPADAVAALLDRLALDTPPDPFAALRGVQDEWYQRYRSHAVPFDGQVALLLARAVLARAGNESQRSMAQNDLGIVLQFIGSRAGDADLLVQSAAAYRAALRVRSEEATPQDWAMTQNNLGVVLQILGQRAGDANLLGQSVTAYRAALRVYSEKATPQDWAMTQNNLGIVLGILGQRAGDTGLLGQSVTAYRAALRVYSEDSTPQDWAMTQNNLGGVLQILGQRAGDADLLGQSVAAHRAALRVYSEEATPQDWASTQNNLGNVLQTLGQRTDDVDLLGQSVAAYRAALRVRSEDATPQDWATTQNNLGAVLRILGQRAGDESLLRESHSAYCAALRLYNETDTPIDWAETTQNMAILDLAMFDLTQDRAHLTAAQTRATAARAVFLRLGARGYLEKIDRLLAKIARRLAA